MTIIRSKVSQDYTVVVNRVTEDKEFSSKYLGVFLRLISKGPNWEISADGLATLYPTEGREFYRNALKHMCKLGYLLRIPQQRENGKFTKVVMELYDYRVIETTLTDEQVEHLFSLEGMDTEEIQKIYPQRVSRCGSAGTDLQTQESIKQQNNNNSVVVSDGCLSDQADLTLQKKEEKSEKNIARRKTFIRPNGTEYELTIDDLHAHVVRNKLRLSMEQILEGWNNLLKHKGAVSDAFKLFESFYKPKEPGGSQWTKTQKNISKNNYLVKGTLPPTLEELRSENEKVKNSTLGSLLKNPFASLMEAREQVKHISPQEYTMSYWKSIKAR